MISDIREHTGHYILLGFILMAGMLLLALFRLQPEVQKYTVIGMSSLYVLWGIFHHKSIGDLDLKVVAEYVLMGVLAVILVNGVLAAQ